MEHRSGTAVYNSKRHSELFGKVFCYGIGDYSRANRAGCKMVFVQHSRRLIPETLNRPIEESFQVKTWEMGLTVCCARSVTCLILGHLLRREEEGSGVWISTVYNITKRSSVSSRGLDGYENKCSSEEEYEWCVSESTYRVGMDERDAGQSGCTRFVVLHSV